MYGMLPYTTWPKDGWMHPNCKLTAQKLYGNFLERLENSVREEGFRNPIHVCDGQPNMANRKPKDVPYGGSRVYVAMELEIPVPALICDLRPFNPKYDGFEEITSLAHCLSKFKDWPSCIEMRPEYFEYWGCAQTQLSDEHRTTFKLHQDKRDGTFRKGKPSYAYYYATEGVVNEWDTERGSK